ncbi:MAG: large subunit ribosomal protein [Patescibacteria group bacterium]|jgi:large subunit ribosomal protein L6|nr:large subunit ribosomal protein [Patescibacteria group bacterium]
MSRIGKQTILITAGVEAKLSDKTFTVKGPKGTLTREFPGNVTIAITGNEITFVPKNADDKKNRALWGTYASHVKNMVNGVSTGYSKKLILEGVGFKSEVAGTVLKLALGFSHPVNVEIPTGLEVKAEKNNITVSGIDKEMVGQFAASVRALKKPEPYKGKGFHYDDEVVRRKQGKKAA